jgi:hypothetical protein
MRLIRYLAARCLVELQDWDDAAAMLDHDMTECLDNDTLPPVRCTASA